MSAVDTVWQADYYIVTVSDEPDIWMTTGY